MSTSDEPSDNAGSAPGAGKTPDDSLVGDLESLRSLLEEVPATAPGPPAGPDAGNDPEVGSNDSQADVSEAPADSKPDPQVPVLDDMIQGTLAIDEDPLEQRELVKPGSSAGSLGDETINALLGDEWRESADRILSAARSAIESVASKWSPQQTTELNQALRVRIDATLEDWLEEVIQQRIDDLRSTLLDAIDAEIAQFIARLEQQDSDAE